MKIHSDFAGHTMADVGEKDSVGDILKKTGLNWDVTQRDMSYEFEGKVMPSRKKALVRSDNGSLLTVTGLGWKPVQNRDIVKMFKDFSDEGGAHLERLGQIRGGRGLWALAKIDSSFKVGGNDEVNGYLLLSSYHEVGNATSICVTANRVACDNAIVWKLDESGRKYIQSHTKHFDFSKARDAVGMAKEEVVKLGIEAKALKSLKMSEFETVRLFASHFVESEGKELDTIVNRMIGDDREQPLAVRQILHSYHKAPGAIQGNGWGALNAVTHWADHVAGNKAEARFDKAMFGNNAQLKLTVKKELLAMA